MVKKYVLDTNILMTTEGKAIYGFDDNTIVIPAIVIEELDNPRLDKKSCGLSYLSERFMGSPLCAQVEFLESESVRSPLAAEAINLL